jgi:hypothetical protein
VSTVAADMLAELQTDTPRVFACVELGAAPLRYAEADINRLDLGLIQGRLTQPIPSYSRKLEPGFGLTSTEFSIEVSDDDLSISKDVAGAAPVLVRGAAAKVRYGAAVSSITPASWVDDWTGIVADTPRMVRERVWSVKVRSNDLPLERPVVSQGWILSRSAFPLAPAASLGQMAPIVLGVHDSVGSTDEGAIPLIRVGPGVYMPSAGGIYGTDRVYVRKVLQSSGWAFSREIIDGRLYSLVRFTTDPAENADGTLDEAVEVTADVHGLTSVGDGSGTTVTDLVDQLTIVANNWWWGSWKSGAWDTTSAPIHAASWATAKAFLAAVSFGGHQGAKRLAGLSTQLPTAGNILLEWCKGVRIYPCWTGAGTIALKAKDHRNAWTYASTPWIRTEDALRPDGGEAGASLSVEYTSQRVDRASVSFLTVGGQARETLEVRDQSITGTGAPESVLAAWGRASTL